MFNSFPAFYPAINHTYMHPHTPQAFFSYLANAHEAGADHSYLMRHMREHLISNHSQVEAYSSSISKYLRNNLQLNIQLVETVNCLPLIHQYLSPPTRKLISATLMQKYSPEVCFFQQLTTLAAINTSLVQAFVWLMRGLSKWFRRQAEQKDYFQLQYQEFQCILNAFHAEERYAFESGLRVGEGEEQGEVVLSLYRITAGMTNRIKDETWIKLMKSLFFYLCNTAVAPSSISKYVFFSVGQMMQMQSTLMEAQQGMVKLIMRKARRAAEGGRHQEQEEVLRLMRNGIVNLLASAWTVEMESFWLWRLKLVCDLLQVQQKMQVGLLREVREIAREVSKLISTN